jgi:hypothetical protein
MNAERKYSFSETLNLVNTRTESVILYTRHAKDVYRTVGEFFGVNPLLLGWTFLFVSWLGILDSFN